MNHRGGWALITGTWLSWMQHRSFFFLLAFGWMMPPLIYLFVWSTAAGETEINGLSRDQFIVYYLVLIIVNQLTYSQTNWTVGDLIRTGGFNRLLLYPISPIYNTLATEIAVKVVTLSFVLPVIIVVGFILHPDVTVSLAGLAAFIPALVLAWLLRFLWGYWLALLAFWMTRSDSLLTLQDSLIFILAGQVAPVTILPSFVQLLAVLLPFRYMIGFPIEVLMGQLTLVELVYGFAFQIGWLVIAFTLFSHLWRRGLRQYTAVGG